MGSLSYFLGAGIPCWKELGAFCLVSILFKIGGEKYAWSKDWLAQGQRIVLAALFGTDKGEKKNSSVSPSLIFSFFIQPRQQGQSLVSINNFFSYCPVILTHTVRDLD